ncbi:MAG: hypothetical protein ACTSR9_13945 [Candidatus Thorarchaeota archaeon]
MKDTKEIVENILQSEASDYDLADPAEIVTSGKTIQIIRGETAETNILPTDTEEMMECCEDTEEMMECCEEDSVMVDGECVSLEDLESYEPGQEIDVEVSELKEGIEKRKKRRNYIEFRLDYEEE